MQCTLCHSETTFFFYSENYDRTYHQCKNCEAVLMAPEDYVTPEEEKARYETHNNDVNDPGYQRFVSPVVEKILQNFDKDSIGLDYGSGPGPVITKILKDQGYTVNTFDPFFDNNPDALAIKYDYIFCCEVIEHFHYPHKEFRKLKEILKTNGLLLCKTYPYTDKTNFKNWHYKNDETHIIFYHPETFKWIRNHIGFSNMEIENQLISFYL